MTVQNFIVNLFELQGYRVRGVEVKGGEILVKVELWRKTGSCPYCGKRTRLIHQYGKERKVWHRLIGEFWKR